MNGTKRRIEPFSFFDQKGICRHLEKMARKGWMIERLTNTGWVYRVAEPREVRFAVSYYPKASEFDPEPSGEQQMLHDLCAHTGWELVCTSAQLQIFCSELADPTPIETEPALEVEAIHASAKKGFLPACFVLAGISVLQGLLFVSGLLGDPIGLLASPTRLVTGFCFVLLTALCSVELGCYCTWHRRAVRAAERGIFLDPPATSGFQKGILWAVIVGGVYYLINTLFSGDPMRRWLVLLLCVVYPLLFVLVNGVKAFLKSRKASRGLNRAMTMGSSCVLAFVLMGAVVFGTLRLSQNGFFAAPEEETYEHNGMTWVIHHDRIPLTMADLTDTTYTGYVEQQSGDESLLLGKLDIHQYPRYDAEDRAGIPSLAYTMVIVKAPFLYDLCKTCLLEKPGNTRASMARTYRLTDAGPWGSSEAYRLHDAQLGPQNMYLLCYERVIVEIRFDWEPDEAQMGVVGEKLGGS